MPLGLHQNIGQGEKVYKHRRSIAKHGKSLVDKPHEKRKRSVTKWRGANKINDGMTREDNLVLHPIIEHGLHLRTNNPNLHLGIIDLGPHLGGSQTIPCL